MAKRRNRKTGLRSRRRVGGNKRRIKSRKYQRSKRMGGSPWWKKDQVGVKQEEMTPTLVAEPVAIQAPGTATTLGEDKSTDPHEEIKRKLKTHKQSYLDAIFENEENITSIFEQALSNVEFEAVVGEIDESLKQKLELSKIQLKERLMVKELEIDHLKPTEIEKLKTELDEYEDEKHKLTFKDASNVVIATNKFKLKGDQQLYDIMHGIIVRNLHSEILLMRGEEARNKLLNAGEMKKFLFSLSAKLISLGIGIIMSILLEETIRASSLAFAIGSLIILGIVCILRKLKLNKLTVLIESNLTELPQMKKAREETLEFMKNTQDLHEGTQVLITILSVIFNIVFVLPASALSSAYIAQLVAVLSPLLIPIWVYFIPEEGKTYIKTKFKTKMAPMIALVEKMKLRKSPPNPELGLESVVPSEPPVGGGPLIDLTRRKKHLKRSLSIKMLLKLRNTDTPSTEKILPSVKLSMEGLLTNDNLSIFELTPQKCELLRTKIESLLDTLGESRGGANNLKKTKTKRRKTKRRKSNKRKTRKTKRRRSTRR